MSRHFLDLDGAATVATEQLLDTRELIAVTLESGGMAAIYGAAGTGKTFAVSEVLRDIPSKRWVHLDFRCRPTIRDIRQAIPTAGSGTVATSAAACSRRMNT